MTSKTLIFCTAFASGNGKPYYTWDIRYRIWVEAIKHSKLEFSQILLVDDGSNLLPSWDDVAILHEEEDLRCDAPIVLYHFNERLGRLSVSDFPGWVRSFFFASRYAEANGFSKIVHIEADAFLISARAIDYVNTLADGWTAFWCKTFRRPESCIQIITGTGLDTFKLWAQRSIESFAGTVIEKTLPFSHVEYGLIGDRYGENGIRVPANADWCAQAYPSRLTAYDSYESYFWWMPWFPAVLPALSIGRTLPEPITHPSAESGLKIFRTYNGFERQKQSWARQYTSRSALTPGILSVQLNVTQCALTLNTP